MHRERQGEDDGLALPEELLELHPPARAVHRGERRQDGVRPGRGRRHDGSPIIRRYTSSRVGRATARSGTSPGNRPASSRTNAVGVGVASEPPHAVLGPADDGGRGLPAAQRRGDGDLDQPAAGDHADPVGERLGLVQVMGGEQHRGAELAQRTDQRPELPARLGVEAGRGLVEEQQRGPADDAERDVEPAALAAGQRLAARPRLLGQARPARAPRRDPAGRGSRRPAPAASRGRSAGCRRRPTAARCPAAPSTGGRRAAGSSPSTRTSPASRVR